MKLEDFNFHLPDDLIAQSGVEPRDVSRLMVLHRDSQLIQHRIFRNILDYLEPTDLLVLNESKVIPARLVAHNANQTAIEVLLIRDIGNGTRWEAMLKPAKRAKGILKFSDGLSASVEEVLEDGSRVLNFSDYVWNHLETLGKIPLPPYIHESVEDERYQTVYAKQLGSVAAPTAGLHFTPELFASLEQRGIETAKVSLHVGPGTFKPVTDDPDKHIMHVEEYEISPADSVKINFAKKDGRRVIAVGTTVVRTLESAFQHGLVREGKGETQIFIRPGFEYQIVDGLITNFHLPKSTLLMLVAAFSGYELMTQAYRDAIAQRYRFYSLGDAMLIL